MILSIIEAYKTFSINAYTQELHQKMEGRLMGAKLLQNDLQYIYLYAENLAAQTVSILINGPEGWKQECKIINEKLVALLLKLKGIKGYSSHEQLLGQGIRAAEFPLDDL